MYKIKNKQINQKQINKRICVTAIKCNLEEAYHLQMLCNLMCPDQKVVVGCPEYADF